MYKSDDDYAYGEEKRKRKRKRKRPGEIRESNFLRPATALVCCMYELLK